MGVYGQSGHVEGVSEYDVRGFAADSGEFYELFEGGGYLPVVAFDELLGEGDDGACLGAVEAEGLNVGFDFFGACGGERGCIGVAREECTGHGVDAHIGGLCREHGGDEQLEGVVEVELCDGVGVGFTEDAVNLAGAAHGGEVAFGCACLEAAGCCGCLEFGDEANLQERFGILCRGVLCVYFGADGVLGHSARLPGFGCVR